MRNFTRNQDGAIAVFFALSLPVMGGAVAAATVSWEVSFARTVTSNALDAAVLAATALGESSTDADRVQRAGEVFVANLGNRANVSPAVTFSVNRASAALVVDGKADFTYRSPFHSWTPVLSTEVSVTASASKRLSDPICVLATARQAPRALEIYGNALFQVDNCASQTNSQNGEAMKIYGGARAVARQFGVTGGATGDGWSPSPNQGVAEVADPYRSLPVPTPGTCLSGIDQKIQNSTVTLEPGTYCGGITIKANSRVFLQRGIYIMKDGPFRVDSNAVVEGQEVLIVLSGANSVLDLQSGASVTITSPRAGTYTNMQVMSDRQLGASKAQQEWSSVKSGATLSYDGVLYMPEQQFWITGTSSQAVVRGRSPTMILVSDSIWVQGNAQVDLRQENSRGLNLPQEARFTYGASLIK